MSYPGIAAPGQENGKTDGEKERGNAAGARAAQGRVWGDGNTSAPLSRKFRVSWSQGMVWVGRDD